MNATEAIESWKELFGGKFRRPSWRGENEDRHALLPEPEEGDLDYLGVSALIDEYTGTGRHLAALAVLKMARSADPEGDQLVRLLGELLEIPPREGASSDDPVPAEFLGSRRPRIAWSVLLRDRMEIVPNRESFGNDSWVLATGSDLGPAGVEWALVWWSDTEVAGKVRPAGRRKVTRNKLELTAAVALLGDANPRQGATRFTAQVTDLTPHGAGIHVVDRFDRLHGVRLNGRRVRIALGVPGRNEPIASIGEICWTEADEMSRSTQMGVKFINPSPELQDGISELMTGKRDVQYLWSLIESNVGKVS